MLLAGRWTLGRDRHALRQRGLSLVETAAVLGVAAAVLGMFANTMADNADQLKAKAVAEKVVEVHAAAQGYIKVHNQALLAASSPTEPLVIPVGRPDVSAEIPSGPSGLPSVQGAGFLPPNFVDRNGYNQQHALLVKRVSSPAGDRLEAVVTTYGGTNIPDRQLARIASFVGASGGYVPSGSGSEIVGIQGGWRSSASDWGNAPERPSAGGIVATMAYEDGTTLNDYLYRNNIGIPEANRMNTALDMGGNDIDYARNVTATGRVTGGTVIAGTAPTSIPPGTTMYSSGDVRGINVWASQNLNADGNVAAGQAVSAGTDVTANGIVSAQGTVYGGNLHSNDHLFVQNGADVRDLSARNDIAAGRNIHADQNITAQNGAVSAHGDVQSTNGNVYAHRGSVAARDNVTGSYVYSTGNVEANVNMHADRYYGKSNWAYSMQPPGTSRLNTVDADAVQARGSLVTLARQNVGGWCSPSGGLAIDNASGDLIFCKNNWWRRVHQNGGVFMQQFDGNCRHANGYTGGCSCPAGQVATAIMDFASEDEAHYFNTGGGVMMYQCVSQ